MSEATAVATTEPRKIHSIEKVITSAEARAYIEPFLPKGADMARVAASLMLAVRQDESGKLKKCTPESLVLGVAQIQKWGLEVGKDSAYLLPFKNNEKSSKDVTVYEATPVVDYKALVTLMIASKAIRYVDAREVREGDKFEFSYGTQGKIVHQPYGGRDRLKKPITYVYCIIHLPFGSQVFDVMTAEEVEEIRQHHSKQWKGGPLKRWYAVKSIIRRISKLVPKDPKLAQFFDVLETERRVEFGETEPAAAIREEDDRPQLVAASSEAGAEHDMDDRWIEQQDQRQADDA